MTRSGGLYGGPKTARVSRARCTWSTALIFRATTASESSGFSEAKAPRSIGVPTRNCARLWLRQNASTEWRNPGASGVPKT